MVAVPVGRPGLARALRVSGVLLHFCENHSGAAALLGDCRFSIGGRRSAVSVFPDARDFCYAILPHPIRLSVRPRSRVVGRCSPRGMDSYGRAAFRRSCSRTVRIVRRTVGRFGRSQRARIIGVAARVFGSDARRHAGRPFVNGRRHHMPLLDCDRLLSAPSRLTRCCQLRSRRLCGQRLRGLCRKHYQRRIVPGCISIV